jgi:cephalosporin hydroxylase
MSKACYRIKQTNNLAIFKCEKLASPKEQFGEKMPTKHTETFLELDELGSQFPLYQPTFELDPKFKKLRDKFFSRIEMNGALIKMKNRRYFGEVIQGWLRWDDALKLYEMAYYTKGDILELGAYHGLSTTLMASAVRESPYKKKIHTVDLQPQNIELATKNLRKAGVIKYVEAIQGDAKKAVKKFADLNRKFQFIFIDHSHAYDPVFSVCRQLHNIIMPGGFCLFHDFNDVRNREPDQKNYGVYQAVLEGLDSKTFEFYGIYGCAGLYGTR